MLKTLFITLVISLAVFAQGEPVPVPLPPIGDAAWELGRNVEAVYTHEITTVDGKPAFHINMTSQAGYVMFRHHIRLEPGDYTFRVNFIGNTRHGSLCEAYSFDEQGRHALLMMLHSDAGNIEETTLQQSFTVPVNSKRVRIGLGVSAGGEVTFAEPQLFKGKLPPPKPVEQEETDPIRSQWLANWIFLKNDPGEPRVDLSREIRAGHGGGVRLPPDDRRQWL